MQISEPPQDNSQSLYGQTQQYWKPDYSSGVNSESALGFSQEPTDIASNPQAFNSLVGFEKNPWVLAYVYVKASTQPKMLFSPFSGDAKGPVTLSAEAYAMPFGGRMGPWYGTTWPVGATESQGSDSTAMIDSLLPPRLDSAPQGGLTPGQPPNYSRYPGDQLGMQSQLARYVELSQIQAAKVTPDVQEYIAAGGLGSDPVVSSPATRIYEIQGIQPDLFDATYYSVDYDFPYRFAGKDGFTQSMCPNVPCYDLGNTLPAPSPRPSISDLMKPPLKKSALAFWGLLLPEHLNTSWSQGDPGQYDDTQAKLSATQRWDNVNGNIPAGGRAGYSVKLVSRSFLLRSDLPLGGGTVVGSISNQPPQ